MSAGCNTPPASATSASVIQGCTCDSDCPPGLYSPYPPVCKHGVCLPEFPTIASNYTSAALTTNVYNTAGASQSSWNSTNAAIPMASNCISNNSSTISSRYSVTIQQATDVASGRNTATSSTPDSQLITSSSEHVSGHDSAFVFAVAIAIFVFYGVI
jgi:hypothetical protein